jgi:hypothetical protein
MEDGTHCLKQTGLFSQTDAELETSQQKTGYLSGIPVVVRGNHSRVGLLEFGFGNHGIASPRIYTTTVAIWCVLFLNLLSLIGI